MSGLALLGGVLLVASAVPFLPTGEVVAGALAVGRASAEMAMAAFAVAWVASFVGDTLLHTQMRMLSGPVKQRLGRRFAGGRLAGVTARVGRGPVTAMAVARLIPGARAAMIATLAMSGVSRRRFLLGDLIGCGLWAALYTGIGLLGASLAEESWIAGLLAVGCAVLVGVVGRRLASGR